MIVLGIDPGLSLTGWGVLEAFSRDKINPVRYGCIKTTPSVSLMQRLQNINAELQSIIDKYKPEAVAIEELFFLKAAKSVTAVGQARGAIILTVSLNKIPLFEYNPKRVKIALTGYGSADKHQMQHIVKTFLRLKEIPKPDDAADALAIAVCHVNTMSWNNTSTIVKS
ncbi:crossover junction endodeoxyribonuclease RuvC [Candidatus Endomicrobiellum agilis]|jgi:crossover junction endodeoxyribonuclease RuvC|uniref:crossover junction endodeoxyribonuclease RuvC n=1 Tax=Candidatus Endomicrobiellum agilis TaxID=3238957 RepID=UPI00283E8603|nr:crossover junction endodeoxyribonuclease RuvC [Endomicrobium sp.]MDR3092522.1 crossover junction endodeoxyribonuclease RuvC [Endomicrobium sp.]